MATKLAKLHAIAVVAAGVGQSRLEPALTEAMGHLRSFVGGEVPVPADLLAAFEGAGPLLALAERQVSAVVHIRYPSTEIAFLRAP